MVDSSPGTALMTSNNSIGTPFMSRFSCEFEMSNVNTCWTPDHCRTWNNQLFSSRVLPRTWWIIYADMDGVRCSWPFVVNSRYKKKVILQWSVSVLSLGEKLGWEEWRWLNPASFSRKRWIDWKRGCRGASSFLWLKGFATDERVVSSHWYGNTKGAFQRPFKTKIDTIYWMDAVRVVPPKQAFTLSWRKWCVA